MEAIMHCLNCGAQASARQKFCRACGLSLAPDIEDEDVAQARRRLRQLETGAKLTGWIVGLGLWLFLSSVIAGIGVNAIINSGNIVFGVILLGMGVGSIAVESLLVYYASLHAKVSTQQRSRPAAPCAETTNKPLPEHRAQSAMSAIDKTTARLDEKIEPRR
jgi:hypothetical protein